MQSQTDRQYYIDWLRAGAMFLLVFYHTGRLFDHAGWHIKNAVGNETINTLNGILDVWQMPLFFLVAGVAVWFSLGSRNAGGFIKERVLRLLVPLIFGMLVLVPPQVYLERVFDGDFGGSFFAWYPHTFQGVYSVGNSSTGSLSWHHLWFLAYLFVFSLLLLPVFKYFRREDKKPLVGHIAEFFTKPGAIYLPVIPLVLINIFLRPIYGWGNQNLVNDWANFLFYIFVFFYGFFMVADNRITQTIKRNTWVSLAAALVFFTIGLLMKENIIATPESIINAVIGIDCWLWLLTFVGVGMRLFNFTNGMLRYANDAVLPVYILHQTLIVVFGYYVIQWNIPVLAKYFFIIVTVLLSSLAIYEVVRRNSVTRFLFGIKVRKQVGEKK